MSTIEARAGESVWEYARRLNEEAKRTGRRVSSVFNGTPIESGSSANEVVDGWYRDREKVQKSSFALRVGIVADTIVGKKIANVVGTYSPDGPHALTITFDDGTTFRCYDLLIL